MVKQLPSRTVQRVALARLALKVLKVSRVKRAKRAILVNKAPKAIPVLRVQRAIPAHRASLVFLCFTPVWICLRLVLYSQSAQKIFQQTVALFGRAISSWEQTVFLAVSMGTMFPRIAQE